MSYGVKCVFFVGCMNNLDPSHYIFSSIYIYGIVVMSVTYCVFLKIIFIVL